MPQLTLYLCHPISDDVQGNLWRIGLLAEKLRDMGHVVVAPHTIADPSERWEKNMVRALRLMLEADAVCVGSDLWASSRGCVIEVLLAKLLDLPIFTVFPVNTEAHRVTDVRPYQTGLPYVIGRLVTLFLKS